MYIYVLPARLFFYSLRHAITCRIIWNQFAIPRDNAAEYDCVYHDLIVHSMPLRYIQIYKKGNNSRLKIRYSFTGGVTLQWYRNERDGVSNHWSLYCLFNRLFRAQMKENIKAPRHWLCPGNSPVTGEFPAQRTSNAENVSIGRHHELLYTHIWVLSDAISLWVNVEINATRCQHISLRGKVFFRSRVIIR